VEHKKLQPGPEKSNCSNKEVMLGKHIGRRFLLSCSYEQSIAWNDERSKKQRLYGGKK
jgi:hypothetical protein